MKRAWRLAIGPALALSLLPPLAAASAGLPLFDAHMHYNVEARSVLTPEQVIALWRHQGVKGVLATSRPNQGTLDLMATLARDGGKDIVIAPFVRPYRVQPDRHDWFANPDIEKLVETELKRGFYRGIGEFHIFGKDADAPYVARMARMAKQRGLWLHAHADEDAVERILRHAPGVRMIWAHTGMSTGLDQVDLMFTRHPSLVGELSYRSDMEENGTLSPRWRALLMKYPDRFVIGTDTWVTSRWSQVPDILATYRRLLAALPPDVAEKIAWRNGISLFAGQ
ncbi:amidohydrolase family protein [Lacisediminimonas profundi]|uniref:amidohydrolase family protein n=1 Tax=Lacisediminimonas profundi TaxID=2603856 RepID=UPI00124B9D96|nr:amidohydrolase family protein [Lacisediminimonas profundi]